MSEGFPVFFDPSGRRWRRAKVILITVGVMSVVLSTLLAVSAAKAVTPDQKLTATAFSPDKRRPSEIAYLTTDEMPVFGQGVFVRVVGLHHQNNQLVAADVYSGKITRTLTAEEKLAVSNKPYAIERYGPAGGKYVVLTFDDGPDPIYTPQILDVLSRESVHSTFFPIGANIVKYPKIAERMAREGHDVANHTFNHADLDLVGDFQARQEIIQTQHMIRAVTGIDSLMFRVPYGGSDDSAVRDDRRAILEAQRLGYSVASYDFDTHDWGFGAGAKVEFPDLHDGVNVLLLHDSGGDRTKTVAYLKELIKKSKAEGYRFTSLSRLMKDYNLNKPANATITDHAAYATANAAMVWPKKLLSGLFVATVFLIFITVILGIVLAELQMLLMKPARRRNNYNPLVSVIIPAYNEESVLKRTVQHVLKSYYRNLEIIIVDDGSTDSTWKIIKDLRRRNKVKGLRQPNSGKAVAINRALQIARGEVIVSVDADTIFLPKTIGKLVRYFYYQDIGAVAGVVKVGNIKNWITRWQALEYVTSIHIERASQAFLRAITVVPGACSAWRKEAILQAGGYSDETLAEDCDLTLAIQKAGYGVVQDMEAVAYTESPESIRMLAKQRFRWMFGNLQAYWKHRDMIFRPRYSWLGCYTIPKALLGIVMQLLFAPMLLFVMIGNLLSGELGMVLFYTAAAYIVLLLTTAVALAFAHEKFSYLSATPAFRLVYSPLRTMLLYASVLAAIGGLELGWNKVSRSGSVNLIE